MKEHPYRYRVTNISRPEMPAVVLTDGELFALDICVYSWGPRAMKIESKRWESCVHRLSEIGFTIERGWRRGTCPYYRLKDVVEIEHPDKVERLGPHPDYQDLPEV